MYEESKELHQIYKTLNATARKALLDTARGLSSNRRNRKAEQDMTAEEFDACVDKVLALCERG